MARHQEISPYLRRPIRSLADIEAERRCLGDFIRDCQDAAECETPHFLERATAKFWDLHAANVAEGLSYEEACEKVYDLDIEDVLAELRRHKEAMQSYAWPDYNWDKGLD